MTTPRFRISARLALAFAVQLMLLGITAAYGLTRIDQMRASIDQITRVNQQESALAMAMQTSLAERMIAVRSVALVSKEPELTQEIARIDRAERSYAEQQSRLENLLPQSASSSIDEYRLLNDATQAAYTAGPLIEDVIAAVRGQSPDKAAALITARLVPVQARWNAALSQLVQIQSAQNQLAADASEAAAVRARQVMGALAILSLAGSALLGWLITRSITRPINDLLGKVKHQAETVAHAAPAPEAMRFDLPLARKELES